jgi:hypothetical protein
MVAEKEHMFFPPEPEVRQTARCPGGRRRTRREVGFMHRSYWDIEVYAKDFQERRWREAAQRRLADEAVSRTVSSGAVNPFNLAVARFLNAWKTRITSGRAAKAPRPAADPVAGVLPEIVALPYRPKRVRGAHPYADMVVIARGPVVGVAEQPSGVRDC